MLANGAWVVALVVYLEMKKQLCAQSSLAAQINDLKMDK